MRWTALLLCGLLAACGDDTGTEVPEPVEHGGVTAAQSGDVVSLSNGVITVGFDLQRGAFSAASVEGTLHLEGAESRAWYQVGDEPDQEVGTTDPGTRSWEAAGLDDSLGSGVALSVRFEPDQADAPTLVTRVVLRADSTYVTVATTAEWTPAPPDGARLHRISPLVADTVGGGALYLGADPSNHRLLDSGYDLYFDFEARVIQVGEGASLGFGPGASANWTVALYDPDSERSLVAGFFSATRGAGIFGVDFQADQAVENNGRAGFTRFEALTHYLDGRAAIERDLEQGSTVADLTSELLYIDFEPPSALLGLERYAERYATHLGKQVWTDVPTGWNSWGGGGGSGGLGTTIDATLMLANLDAAATDFLPYGMKYFMLDDGWQISDGEWQPNQQRFPDQGGQNGMAWFADQVRARGMIPGIWVSPYTVDQDSQLALDHPDWMAELSPLGGGVVPQDQHVIDLSNPEVLDWLAEVFSRVTQDWGYEWIKMDFSYYALFTTNLYDPDVTPTEAYRTALGRIREAIGPDVFLLTIAATGLCLDVADGGRVTLDNEPWWGDPNFIGDQGVKVTYKTIARRYYLNHRLWINHPDLLFYRDLFELTPEEARAWTSAVALSGGIVKLGENYLDLHDHPEWRAMVTPLLPVYPATGRPLDLFLREYPEIWQLPVTRGGESWQVVGLFNWGLNKEIGASDFEAESVRDYTVDFGELGLDIGLTFLVFDAWNRTWDWIAEGTVTETLDPRTSRVLVVREEPSTPAIVFTSRHLLGGAVEVHNEAWDDGAAELSAVLDTVAGDPLEVFVAEAGRTVQVVEASGVADATPVSLDGITTISFTPTAAETTLTVGF
ncbi:MAG: alpha-galactosidase [bacterium]